MRILFFLTAIVLLTPMSQSVAQDRFGVEAGVGMLFMGETSEVLREWGDGWSAGAAATYFIWPNLEIGTV